jgi:hypothetical protein
MSTGLTLYEITAELVALADTLDLCDTEEQQAECAADIERSRAVLIRKVDDFSRFLAHLESQTRLAAVEIERLKTLREILSRRQQRLEQYAVRVMQNLDLKKLEGDTSRLSLRQNPSAVEITNLSLVPDEFTTTEHTVVPDKRAIKKAIESGRDVPGCDLRFGAVSLVRK